MAVITLQALSTFVTAPSLGVFLKRSYKRDKKNKTVCKRESKLNVWRRFTHSQYMRTNYIF
ncbi:hypothetical protein BpHYR1_029896 [Brachionus plicatilis]|uniref:Uncharacterized protein n=1 Tax=Brachionus plicatilis TaxID=10195 RepID=A0A3M7PZ77_BRAPC|nr:hypothetical protein BpHYR1_029896 [Brachionus plicatilis]